MSLAKQPSSLLFSKLARTAMAAARHGTHAGSAAPDPGGGRKAAGGAAPAAPRGTAPPARREERELCRPFPALPPFSGAVAQRLRAPQPAPGSGIALREQRSAAGLALAGHCVHKDGTVGPGTPLWAQTQRWHPRTWVLHRPCAWTCHLMPSPSVMDQCLDLSPHAITICVLRHAAVCWHRLRAQAHHRVSSLSLDTDACCGLKCAAVCHHCLLAWTYHHGLDHHRGPTLPMCWKKTCPDATDVRA